MSAPSRDLPRLVLFDIDGTLLTSDGAARRSFEGALTAVFGSTGDPRVRFDGKTDPQIARELMRADGWDDAEIDARLDAVIAGYLERLRREVGDGTRHFTALPGVAPLLDALEARTDVVLGLLTGNVADGAAVKLDAAGIARARFRVNAFGCDAEHRPELPIVARRRARDLLGVELPGEAIWVIGDTPADVQCARSVGARTLAVATGRYAVGELAEHAPTVVLPDLTDTDAVVAALVA
jgi:phosphoglycolate phosphatase-like HAD superfamily hydrolase